MLMIPSAATELLCDLQNAEIVQFNGEFGTLDYINLPDKEEGHHPDDVVLELNFDDDEVDFTLAELESAKPLGGGVYLVPGRGYLRCLFQATLH